MDLCAALGVTLSGQQLEALLKAMDRDGDRSVQFDEFLAWLASEDPEMAVIRAKLRNCEASVMAGVFRATAMQWVAAFFSNPISLFREYYMSYFALICERAERAAKRPVSLGEALRMELRSSGWPRTLGRIGTAVAVDSSAGAVMFLTYANTKTYLNGTNNWGPLGKEFCSGAFAGAVSSTLMTPLNNLRHTRAEGGPKVTKISDLFHGAPRSLIHDSLGYGAFFVSYSACCSAARRLAKKTGYRRSTATDAVIAVVGGCAAGAGYRLVTTPQQNLYLWHQAQPRTTDTARSAVRSFVSSVPAAQWPRILFSGFVRNCVGAVPASAAVFLLYEFCLIRPQR
eukprot:TRINITY_DN19343_c0_g1_i1.p1 TRINITY_DN19343_c0_g1~~TRINITY_DN19343_c0_g1_i1.p1  ORF type:complete len:383 (+),score=42.32 TRINITY_DN19343_c0_g1_i1:127-1149(+)